ncbi:amidophosphoribosyltransferase [Vulcanimicrobium alpinum]|uniref:Amidophosphoribosyltransferase n=1 Tax=Vulcanimicrobium alpinum TaxID=3016050 RepID=A0AAN1XV31_UNVUL|nr:amidophosphoribosyltransferase [Vulcanimicrobium alpinum]BDE05971.1 amidophosphoribosyltransferase [Vulcanimicrobium alpinum]
MARAYDEQAEQPAGDVLHEACGIAGVYAPGDDVARLVYFGLYALQHRGQESAGIAVGDGRAIDSHREMGLITGVFDEEILGRLRGDVAIGHTRYSTTGSSIVVNAQPFIEESDLGTFAFGHNGNLTNADDIAAMLPDDVRLTATSDSEILAKFIARAPGATWVEKIKAAMRVAEGAYSVVMCTRDTVFGFRDPWGVRPLCIGTYGDSGYMIASESCALATVGAHYLREIAAGEVVAIHARGIRTEHTEVVKPPSLCMFEYIYFARPDSVLSGRSIYMARYEMGRALARQHPADADVVMAIPDSAIPGGIGYAAESGLPYVEGLIKNRYIGRTFISPDQKMRSQGVRLKFNPVVENLRGQRVVVVDDSIVRGTTTPRIVSLLRDVGVREVHLRITSPPIVHPCYLGVDMASYAELIAANLSVEQICENVGADSLGYLSIENLVASTGRERRDFCLGCLNGRYPSVPAVSHGVQADMQPALKG